MGGLGRAFFLPSLPPTPGYNLDTIHDPPYNPPMGTRLADLWASSALIQGIMALVCLFAIVYLALTNQPVPRVLVATLSVIIGFYFGQKNAINRPTQHQSPGGDTWHA